MSEDWKACIVGSLIVIMIIAFSAVGHCVEVVSLSWGQNISEGFAGWRVYTANQSGGSYVFVPNPDDQENDLSLVYYYGMTEYNITFEVRIPSWVPTTYYFVVVAVNELGYESGYSNEVFKTFIPDVGVLTAPYNLEIQ